MSRHDIYSNKQAIRNVHNSNVKYLTRLTPHTTAA